jgi:hypothetical protein
MAHANIDYAAHKQTLNWGGPEFSRGKITDMIEAQRHGWDCKVEDLNRACPASVLNAFDPSIRSRRRARPMCKPQAEEVMRVENRRRSRARVSVAPEPDTDDTAGVARLMLKMAIAASLDGAGRVLHVIGRDEYGDHARVLCEQLGGWLHMVDCSTVDGSPLRTVYKFRDDSRLVVWHE